MKRDKILIVINSLQCGGAEKSLVSFLNEVNYDKYDIDLQLINIRGDFLCLLNKSVNVLECLDFISFCNMSFIQQLKSFNIKYFIMKIKLTVLLRVNKKLHDSQIYWKSCQKCFKKVKKSYDIAIAWGQGLPTYYVSSKVDAKKKFAWINVDYNKAGYDRYFDYPYYDKIDNIVLVSTDLKILFEKVFPEFIDKMVVIYDINSYSLVNHMAKEEFSLDKSSICLVTVGRLVLQKGYDLAIDTAEILKNNGIDFKWYFVGDGPERDHLENLIHQKKLENYINIEGFQINPYKYMKNADIYVQTSRFEGFCITLAEARMLNKPIVTTNFDVVYDQMKSGVNGLVVDMQPQNIADGIIKIINEPDLKEKFITNLKKEKKGNQDEINKFYKLADYLEEK